MAFDLQISRDAFDCIFIRFDFVLPGNIGQFVQDSLWKLKRLGDFLTPIFNCLNVHLIDFELVQALTVLVDQTDNIFEELVERLTLEVKAH